MINIFIISSVAVSIAVMGGGEQEFCNSEEVGDPVAAFMFILTLLGMLSIALWLFTIITKELINDPSNHTKPNHIIEVIDPVTHEK